MNTHVQLRIRKVGCWLLTGLLFSLLLRPIYAQSSSASTTQVWPDDIRAAAEVSKRFQQRLIETKDLSALVNEFFTINPNRFFPGQLDEFVKDATLRKQISSADWDDHILSFMSLCYMWLVSTMAKNKGITGDIESPNKVFPAPVLEKIKKDPHLAQITSDEFEPTIKSVAQMRAMTQSLKVVLSDYRAYLDSHPAEWRPIYDQVIKEMEKKQRVESSAVSLKCHGKDCYGKPEGTPLFRVVSIPFSLTLVNEQGQLKVLKIEMIGN